jgi:hypothetical protein
MKLNRLRITPHETEIISLNFTFPFLYGHKKLKKKKKKKKLDKYSQSIQSNKRKLHKRVSNYRAFSIKGTNIAKHSIEYMHLSKLFNIEYSVGLSW